MNIGIITVSDTCSKDNTKDKSGPKLLSLIEEAYPDCKACRWIVSDDIEQIKNAIIEFTKIDSDVIFTTGGTGFAPRDVTPEATKQLITTETPAIDVAILMEGLKITSKAMLSRGTSGIYGKTLIVNLSGSVKAVTDQFSAIKEVIPHAVDLIHDKKDKVQKDHENLQKEIIFSSPSKVKMNVANRNRYSPYKMISVDEAYAIIMSICVQESEIELLNVSDALGRVLTEDIRSYDSLPPFPSSIKDGYAVKATDGLGKRTVVNGVVAGDCPDQQEIQAGQCMRISTGAPVPPGADAIVQVEDTKLLSSSLDGSQELEIEILVTPIKGQDIRPIGCDIERYSIVMKKGVILNAAEIGVLAAVGKLNIRVYKRPTIGVISTGNEIQDPKLPLEYGKIRDSNKITLLALIKQYGYYGLDMGIAKDEPSAVKNILEKAFSKCDMVITTGGVSMGEYDVIKLVLDVDFKAKIHFGRVDMKPGKPTTFATCLYNGKIKTIFGLPGNPVSATVTCLLFVIPTLRYMENRSQIFYPKIQVEVDFEPKQDPERPEYQRVYLKFGESVVQAQTTGNQISSRLNSFVGADGLLIVPPKKLSKDQDYDIENNLDCKKINIKEENKLNENQIKSTEEANNKIPLCQPQSFGSQPAGSGFGSQPAGSGFGSQSAGSGFGSQSAGSSFGGQPAGSGFGSQPAGSGFGSQLAGSGFESQPAGSFSENLFTPSVSKSRSAQSIFRGQLEGFGTQPVTKPNTSFAYSKNGDDNNEKKLASSEKHSYEENRINFKMPNKKYWCYILDKN